MVSLLLPLAAALVAATAPAGAGGEGAAPGAAPATSSPAGVAEPGPGPPAESPASPAAQAGAAEAAARPAGGRSWFVLPVVFWLPETKLGFAAAAGIHFHVAKGAGDSDAFLVAGYTILGQSTVDLSTDLRLKGGAVLEGHLRFAYYPDTYYGIGTHTTLDEREDLTRRFGEGLFAAEFPIFRGLRAGPRLHLRTEEILDATAGGAIANGEVPGANGFDALGVGVQATWDERDNPLWTTRGWYLDAWYLKYPSGIGRNSGFDRSAFEARWFQPLPRRFVLGFAAQLEHASATTPFSILPKLGNTRYLRGIRDGRFRDSNGWAAQTELRVPISGKFAAAAFAAFGDVNRSFASQRWDTMKFAGGAGLRYRLTKQGANIRADVAVSPQGEGVEFYVLLLEAF